MDIRIPPLELKILLESIPLKSRVSVRRLVVTAGLCDELRRVGVARGLLREGLSNNNDMHNITLMLLEYYYNNYNNNTN